MILLKMAWNLEAKASKLWLTRRRRPSFEEEKKVDKTSYAGIFGVIVSIKKPTNFF